jgi:hypothetical protein
VVALQQVADAHYQASQEIVRVTAEQTQELWQDLVAETVIQQWMEFLAAAVQLLTRGQLAAATLAMPYLRQVAAAQAATAPLDAMVVASAFAGVAADGRALASLLMQPALRTAGLLARGADDQTALRSGLASLTRIVATEIPDAGRSAVSVGMVANRRYTSYLRMLRLPSCGRCIVLAGRQYSWSEGFARHDRCDCYHLPIVHNGTEQLPGETPRQVFDRMTRQQQDDAFGRDAAEAIRAGGDISQVVNARRGVSVAGGREFTTSGTSRRGRAAGQARLTPAQIIRDAAGNRDAAVEQLRRFGYIT